MEPVRLGRSHSRAPGNSVAPGPPVRWMWAGEQSFAARAERPWLRTSRVRRVQWLEVALVAKVSDKACQERGTVLAESLVLTTDI